MRPSNIIGLFASKKSFAIGWLRILNFELYDELFPIIPNEGDINSHRAILLREAEYLNVQISDGAEVQALLQEITDLRQQLLEVEVNAVTTLAQNNLNI